ncbi:MAG: glycosyltransferase family 39 protein [Pseudomonadota bacterium]
MNQVLRSDIRSLTAEHAGVLILGLAVVLRLLNLGGTSLWYDEGIYLLNSQGSFAELIHNTQTQNSSPIGFPFLLWLIDNTLGLNAFTARLPSAIAGILSVWVVLSLTKVGANRAVALIAALMLAVAPMQILYAQEVREYAFSILASAVILWAYLAAYNQGRILPLIVALCVAPWFSYGACFTALAALVSLAGARLFQPIDVQWRAVGAAFLAFVVSLVLVYLSFAQYQMYTGEVWYLQEHYLAQSGLNPVVWLVLNSGGVLLASLPGLLAVVVIPILLAIYYFRYVRAPLEITKEPLLLIFLVLFGGLIAGGILEVYPFGSPRHSVFVGPVMAAAAARVIYLLYQAHSPKPFIWGGVGALALLFVSAGFSLSQSNIGKGLHPALDKVLSVNVYGEYEDNRSLFSWAREKADEGLTLYASPGCKPSNALYGQGLDVTVAPFRMLGDPESYAESIFAELETAPIALLFSATVPGEARQVKTLLEAKGVNVSIDFEGTRVVGLVVTP